jgi:ribosomal protein L16 Arg81 hydroxylase
MMITLLIFILLDLLNAWSYCSLRYVNNRRSELYRRRTPSAGKNRLHNALSNADELSSPCCVNVKVIENVEPSESFQDIFLQSQSWGRNPLLIRGAFKNEAHYLSQVQITSTDVKQPHLFQRNPWPRWEDIKKLASNEDAESRWITHIPKDDTSWNLDLGPFDPDDVDEALSTFDQTEPTCDDSLDEIIRSTLIVNDVDRFIPTLSDWINENFSFIPNWRRDDGQVSLAHNGGGIGPHVDEYDVFLIQMAGIRRWELGKRFISVVEELEKDFLIQGLDVRIILNWHDEIGKEFILHPGDILYLPPRLAHCGIARR